MWIDKNIDGWILRYNRGRRFNNLNIWSIIPSNDLWPHHNRPVQRPHGPLETRVRYMCWGLSDIGGGQCLSTFTVATRVVPCRVSWQTWPRSHPPNLRGQSLFQWAFVQLWMCNNTTYILPPQNIARSSTGHRCQDSRQKTLLSFDLLDHSASLLRHMCLFPNAPSSAQPQVSVVGGDGGLDPCVKGASVGPSDAATTPPPTAFGRPQ